VTRLIRHAALAAAFPGACAPPPRSAAPAALALTHATVVDGTGAAPLRDATVVIADGRITCVGRCRAPAGARVVDARGRYVIPGLVDAHVHYDGSGWVDTRPAGVDVSRRFPYAAVVADLRAHPERYHRSHLCAGTTAVFDPGGPPWTLDLRAAAERSPAAPHVAAAGPMLTTIPRLSDDTAARALNVFMADDASVRAGVRMLAARKSDAVKLWGLEIPSAPEDRAALRARLRAAAAEARAAGLPVVAHATSLRAAKDALREAGASVLVHSVEDTLVDAEFLDLARRAGAVYVPTLLVGAGYDRVRARHFPADSVPLACVDPLTRRKARLTDSLPPNAGDDPRAAGARAERARRIMAENLRRVHAAGIPVAAGTDAGNPLTLHGPALAAELAAMAEAGLAPEAVLAAATRHGARVLRRPDLGTLRPGHAADLVVLARDPLADVANVRSVELVVRGGRLWTRAELAYP
jgi:imidazolonepropionase-like amidohydrolase